MTHCCHSRWELHAAAPETAAGVAAGVAAPGDEAAPDMMQALSAPGAIGKGGSSHVAVGLAAAHVGLGRVAAEGS